MPALAPGSARGRCESVERRNPAVAACEWPRPLTGSCDSCPSLAGRGRLQEFQILHSALGRCGAVLGVVKAMPRTASPRRPGPSETRTLLPRWIRSHDRFSSTHHHALRDSGGRTGLILRRTAGVTSELPGCLRGSPTKAKERHARLKGHYLARCQGARSLANLRERSSAADPTSTGNTTTIWPGSRGACTSLRGHVMPA